MWPLFQSLGRDSGCSSDRQTWAAIWQCHVSIPRSGFWVFKRRHQQRSDAQARSFNPSVGILGVQASTALIRRPHYYQFQSLGRDSGCSSRRPALARRPPPAVSIPRSGFWVFKHRRPASIPPFASVSIPRSGFWVFKRAANRPAPRSEPVSIPRSGFWVFKPP